MSFLYEALLKKDRQNNAAAAPQASGMQSVFADEGQSNSPVGLWIALAIALLIIGVLAGYIVGQQGQRQPIQYVERPAEPAGVQSPVEVSQQESETPQVPPMNLAQVHTQAERATQPEATDGPAASMSNQAVEKQFEVSVDQNGVVQSAVVESQLDDDLPSQSNEGTTNSEETAEQKYITANTQDVMDLEQVPENLRESFKLAVAATSEQADNSAYQSETPQITNSSSLPDITELSDTDRAGLPPILYQMHIYASDKTDRWVKLNDRVMTEGEEFMPGLKLLEIRQDIIVWETRFNRFSQDALEDYSAL